MKVERMRRVTLAILAVTFLCGSAQALGSDGLVAHWKFDEGTGPTAYDSAGTNDGTLVNGPVWTTGVLDGALEFDGINDYVTVPDDPSLNITGDITVSAWVYFARGGTGQEGSQQGIVTKCSEAGARNNPFDFRTDVSGVPCLFFNRANASEYQYIYGTESIPILEWHHVLVRVENKVPDFYIDGALGGKTGDTTFTITPTANSKPVLLGRRDDGLHLAGTIDDVRIYDRALSAEEIEELYQAGQGPLAHWKFDEGAGGIAYDSVGDNDGTLVNSPVWATGILDGALDFDGDNGVYIEGSSGVDSNLNIYNSDLTISCWAKRRGTGGTIVARTKPSYHAYVLAVATDRALIDTYKIGPGHWTLYTDEILNEDTWHHIVGVFDRAGDMGRVYVDGIEEANGIMVTDPVSNDAATKIGCRHNTSDFAFNGVIDDVRIYGRALSAEEIRQLYEEGLPEPPRVFYVDGVNGSDLNDGLSLETAFATIQKGIDEANDADTVLVYPAAYAETTDFKGKAITLQGLATSAGVPIIEAPGDLAVSFYMAEEANSVLQNFIIRNSFRGVFIAGAAPTIGNLIVVDNNLGIVAYAGAEPNISNCIFYNNTDGDLFQCEARYSWRQQGLGPVAEGLVSYWKFDEGSGSTAYDSAGTNDGTIYGAQWTSGVLGGALEFDGVGDYVGIGNPASLNFAGLITIAAWIKPEAIAGVDINRNIVAHGHGGFQDQAVYLRIANDGQYEVGSHIQDSTDTGRAQYVVPLGDKGNWVHLAGLHDGSDWRLYRNGVEVASKNVPIGGIQVDEDWAIGARGTGTERFFTGSVDDVRIYDRALSAEEVEEVYRHGLGPLFTDAAGGDYHLRSERGRYWPEHDVWVLDDVTSPGVDGGDPSVYPGEEPMPDGGRINMGAYGGTPYASMSEWPIEEDNNRDGIVNFLDLANLAARWLEELAWFE
ncbi:MAG: LamG domain-containing protein [Planctomycetota bacterium]|jgi:hypothetical protein